MPTRVKHKIFYVLPSDAYSGSNVQRPIGNVASSKTLIIGSQFSELSKHSLKRRLALYDSESVSSIKLNLYDHKDVNTINCQYKNKMPVQNILTGTIRKHF